MNALKCRPLNGRQEALVAALMLVSSVVLCFPVHGWFDRWPGNRGENAGNPLALLIGDGRKVFASHFFIKADAYFHSGFYPSVFDNTEAFRTPHMAEDAGALAGKNQGDERSFLGDSRDWIEQFGRQFFPSRHTHLDEGGAGGELADSNEVREILPWIRLAAELDPQKIETYVVASYWLRQRMGRVAEAEAFLRQGLRANPRSFAILFELGRIAEEVRQDDALARNLWTLGIRYWNEQEKAKDEPDTFLLSQLSSRLALLEQRTGSALEALRHMKVWQRTSPDPASVQQRIEAILEKQPELREPFGSIPD